MISQHWFRLWFGAMRQQAITWASVVTIWHHQSTMSKIIRWDLMKCLGVKQFLHASAMYDWSLAHCSVSWPYQCQPICLNKLWWDSCHPGGHCWHYYTGTPPSHCNSFEGYMPCVDACRTYVKITCGKRNFQMNCVDFQKKKKKKLLGAPVVAPVKGANLIWFIAEMAGHHKVTYWLGCFMDAIIHSSNKHQIEPMVGQLRPTIG